MEVWDLQVLMKTLLNLVTGRLKSLGDKRLMLLLKANPKTHVGEAQEEEGSSGCCLLLSCVECGLQWHLVICSFLVFELSYYVLY